MLAGSEPFHPSLLVIANEAVDGLEGRWTDWLSSSV